MGWSCIIFERSDVNVLYLYLPCACSVRVDHCFSFTFLLFIKYHVILLPQYFSFVAARLTDQNPRTHNTRRQHPQRTQTTQLTTTIGRCANQTASSATVTPYFNTCDHIAYPALYSTAVHAVFEDFSSSISDN